jgi:hypothetical protein
LEIHLEIGEVMSNGANDIISDLFSAVYHLNKALPIIYDPQSRERLRKLNLRAAQLGNYGIAFEFALDCIHTALMYASLLPPSPSLPPSLSFSPSLLLLLSLASHYNFIQASSTRLLGV